MQEARLLGEWAGLLQCTAAGVGYSDGWRWALHVEEDSEIGDGIPIKVSSRFRFHRVWSGMVRSMFSMNMGIIPSTVGRL